MIRKAILSTLLVVAAGAAMGKTTYCAYPNDFAPLEWKDAPGLTTKLEKKTVVARNLSPQPQMLLLTEPQQGGTLQIVASVAQLSKKTDSQWGIVFNRTDSLNYSALTVSIAKPDLFALTPTDSLLLQLIDVRNGVNTVLHRQAVQKNVAFGGKPNSVSVAFANDSTIHILAGSKQMGQVFKYVGMRPLRGARCGILVGGNASVQIEKVVMREQDEPLARLAATITADSVATRLKKPMGYEGLWQYLDRDLNEKVLKIGGRYTVALLANSSGGYDIIYIGGAEVNADKWKIGMLKGRLLPTQFAGTYDLLWHDSDGKEFSLDVYAQFAEGILTLFFPAQNSQIRFARQE